MKKAILSAFFVVLIAVAASAQPVKNVIFMIGDGMGLNQVYAALTANGGTLNMVQMPVTGLSVTYSANNYTTDSAAGGTALAAGAKTKNGMVGLASDSVTRLYSSLYYAQQSGKATGVVVTSPVTHATPASFYAHRTSRHLYEDIALDLLASNIDVAVGGGRNHFEARNDGRKLTEDFAAKGYEVVYTEADFATAQSDHVLALLAGIDMPVASERGDYLPNAVKKTLDILAKNDSGFFLMVEGSQIDYQCHNNNIEETINEVLDFDKAVGVALAFAKTHGNTLVVVTADHETGGLVILDGNIAEKTVETEFNKTKHTGVPVPIFAFGPGAERFTGMQQNIDLFNKVLQLMGVELAK